MAKRRSFGQVVDDLLLQVAPKWALSRARNRLAVMGYRRAYEAANDTRLRKKARDFGSGNNATMASALAVRNLSRHLDRNHDIARGILSTMVRNVVGPQGIGVECSPLLPDGTIDTDLAYQLQGLWREFCERPEVTGEHDWGSACRLLSRSWLRDGEVLSQMISGHVPGLRHGKQVPFSLELIEADLLDLDFHDPARNILQSVQRNAWNESVAYHVYKQHPGDPWSGWTGERKAISAEFVRHLKMVDRIGQVRGMSLFASVLTRLDDLKDYEESERVAAKIAASLAAYIKKGDPQSYGDYTGAGAGADGQAGAGLDAGPRPRRELYFESGMIIDDLAPGEDIGMIDSKRPNAGLEPFRDGQLRAVAAGTDGSFSGVAKKYDGSYSAMRQELVDQWNAYAVLSQSFISQFVRPVYQRFVSTAILSGRISVAPGRDIKQISKALYVAPQMPWIDPEKEARGFEILSQNHWMTDQEIIRRRGGNPSDVLEQKEEWAKRLRDYGLSDDTAQGNA